MSDFSTVNSKDVQKESTNPEIYAANKQKEIESSNLNSISQFNIKPHDRLLALCSGVEPALSCLNSSQVKRDHEVPNANVNIPSAKSFGPTCYNSISTFDVESVITMRGAKLIQNQTSDSSTLSPDAAMDTHRVPTNTNQAKAIVKRKSNSPPFDTSIINVKNNKPNYITQHDVIDSDCLYTSMSCPSHLSTRQDNFLDENSDNIQQCETTNSRLGNEDTFCERRITPCRQALRHAVHNLYRIDDFHMEKIGAGFFSEVFKVTHKITTNEMVLKLNKHRSNRTNMLKEIQLMKNLNHANVLRLEGACVHEGQLHALTEYADGGNLEQVIERKDDELPWSVRMSLALDVAKGLAYLHSKGWFHRDLTSKNILICINNCKEDKINGIRINIGSRAVIGDFGLATKIPTRSVGKDFRRLQQVGSPYWMSPECLKGEFYDEKADLFSYGIILCELIARMGADPDVLPRTSNFGVDYIAFSAICPTCPPDFLQLTFNCVRIDPNSRPSAQDLVGQLQKIFDTERRRGKKTLLFPNQPTSPIVNEKIILKKVGHRRTFSEISIEGREKANIGFPPIAVEDPALSIEANTPGSIETHITEDEKGSHSTNVRQKNQQKYTSPSEKARFHFRTVAKSVLSVGKEMSEKDPYYKPQHDVEEKDPFLALPLFLNGPKILSEGDEKTPDLKKIEQFLFSSCFELTPNVSPNINSTYDNSKVHENGSLSIQKKENKNNPNQIISKNASNAPAKRHSLPKLSNPASKDTLCINEPAMHYENHLQNDLLSDANKDIVDNARLQENPMPPLTSVASVLSKNTNNASSSNVTREELERTKRNITSANINRYFEDQMFQGRVQLLRRLYGGGCWVTQDDSAIEMSSFSSTSSATSEAASIFNLPADTVSHLKRRGSCESGFFSSGFGGNGSELRSRYARGTSSNASGGCYIDDWCSNGMMSSSARSVGSSLLTVSDLEEDLRAASIFLSSKRTSSIFTDDSIDDISSLADFDNWDQRIARSTSTPHGSNCNILEASTPNSRLTAYSTGSGAVVDTPENRCYEKDIREIVNYFNSITLNPEANGCSRLGHVSSRTTRQRELDMLFGRKFTSNGATIKTSNNSNQQFTKREFLQNSGVNSHYSQKSILPRSHKIESLIKRVAEKESRQRYRKTFGHPTPLSASMFQQHQQRLQICDGIVRSKLQIFDHTKKPPRSRLLDHQKQGHVKAKLAIFDSKLPTHSKKSLIGPLHDIGPEPNFNEINRDEDFLDDTANLKPVTENHLRLLKDNSFDSTETLNA